MGRPRHADNVMSKRRSQSNLDGRIHNRIVAVLAHTTRYAFRGMARLATDSGVSKSAISRIIRGHSQPSFRVASNISRALERHLGRRIDPHELLSLDGSYPTQSVCQFMGCRGCLPEEAFEASGALRADFQGIQPGQWSGDTVLDMEPSQ
jgi:DNA-binding phage protein